MEPATLKISNPNCQTMGWRWNFTCNITKDTDVDDRDFEQVMQPLDSDGDGTPDYRDKSFSQCNGF
jgi:hypothetical protein